MKLNYDCVRKVLLEIEALEYGESVASSDLNIDGFKQLEVSYTVAKLFEAGYINANPRQYQYESMPIFIIETLTWEGHKFLDNIRDNNVFNTAKGVASKFASVSISMFENIASQVITNMINKYMGIC